MATHPAPAQRWVYRARCERVIDADTLLVRIDMGLHVERVERVRLAFVDAPERGTPEGIGAAVYTLGWLGVGPFDAFGFAAAKADWPLLIETTKTDDFGRWLGTIWRAGDGACLNDDLLAAEFAAPYPAPK